MIPVRVFYIKPDNHYDPSPVHQFVSSSVPDKGHRIYCAEEAMVVVKVAWFIIDHQPNVDVYIVEKERAIRDYEIY